jgi:hypothetical protein
MTNREILFERIETLPLEYLGEVVDFVEFLRQKKEKNNALLEKAADLACSDYRTDKELTAFCSLDGEAFYETR